MARFRCRSCGHDGTWTYDPARHTCPLCDSIDVQFAIGIDELPDDDPLIQALTRMAEGGDASDEVACSFSCASCGGTGELRWDPASEQACPRCGSTDVVVRLYALGVPDDIAEALIEAQLRDGKDDED